MKKILKFFLILIIFYTVFGYVAIKYDITGKILEAQVKEECFKYQKWIKDGIRKDLFNPSTEIKFHCGELGVQIDPPRGKKEIRI